MTEKRKFWNDEDSALLREMSESSSFLDEMAAAVGRNENATRLQLNKLGIRFQKRSSPGAPRSVWTEERLAWLQDELRTKPVSQVATESGISRKSILGAVDGYGLQRMSREDAVRSEWRRANLSATAKRKLNEKYPPEGPWECVSCHELKPIEEFAVGFFNGRQCYECQYLKHVERTYSITRERYWEMWEKQGGTCAICCQPETATHPKTGRVYMLSVDHDHKCCAGKTSCGKCVRHLLCARCNQTVGHLEKAGIAEAVAAYIAEVY